MNNQSKVEQYKRGGRTVRRARKGDSDELGPLALLPGKWANEPGLPGRGWNMIALPFATEPVSPINYRLLVNQFNEQLEFTLIDKGVPNRGIIDPGTSQDTDQLVVTLDYEQQIKQVAVDDFPVSEKRGLIGQAIHHEPGLWLYMLNQTKPSVDVARLASIPHGDSVLALGSSDRIEGAPEIPRVNGLPIGATQDLASRYLEPYRRFHEAPFLGLFDPVSPHLLLEKANEGVNILRHTRLAVDTENASGGISNIPFVVKQANPTSMKSTFWIQEILEPDGKRKLRLQYLQVVMLEFFPRFDGGPGRIQWPHVSINTMEKVEEPQS